ncbi:sulfur carrier protein [Evansella vedderi]|uniref:Sulfur carrier protein n=1 Tax=Evansella vedderi TaxID=38282 RepID=A0ABT9ZRY4_9BACI|nr:sulfur carrier protein ThiS [Evansella vedderi]MDQ0253998.1 sulfur carrier protein [Evansella vedderi]
MKIQVNGKQSEIPSNVTTVSELLSYYELDNKVVIVELNEQIVDKESHKETTLQDGDRVELVHFVGGG